MKPEEIEPNHVKNMAIEELQWRINVVKENSSPNQEEIINQVIKAFIEEVGDHEEVKITSVEQAKNELKKLEKRQEIEKARYDDDGR